MTLSQFKSKLETLDILYFQLPDGTLVPSHFHVTEIGKINKQFIDCGGKVRIEEKVNFQLWDANDYNHRLHPEKLLKIIHISEKILHLSDLEIEVEYQGNTIEKFGLSYNGTHFQLTTTKTDCLAKEACGITTPKPKINLSTIQNSKCLPESGCC